MLSYQDMKLVCISYLGSFSEINQKRLLMALDSCEDMKSEREKKFRLYRILHLILWDFEEAIEIGFINFINCKFPERLEAIKYHSLNKEKDCFCNICKLVEMPA